MAEVIRADLLANRSCATMLSFYRNRRKSEENHRLNSRGRLLGHHKHRKIIIKEDNIKLLMP